MTITILTGCCLSLLETLPDQSVQACITSPPYWGLRDYQIAGQLGLEQTPDEYVARMVAVFREVRRVLRDDGTCWINIGDCYAGSGRGGYTGGKSGLQGSTDGQDQSRIARGSQLHAGLHETARQAGAVGRAWVPPPAGLKQKDLVGVPWMLAFALRADGWWLREDIIWSKPNCMPESANDRCTRSHEYLFHFSKSARYYHDKDAITEPCTQDEFADGFRGGAYCNNSTFNNAEGGKRKRSGNKRRLTGADRGRPDSHLGGSIPWEGATRNKRSVWTVATKPFPEAHFATYPPELIEPCILAGCPAGGTVLDPFAGAFTTALVADRLGRHAIGIEINPEYVEMAKRRLAKDAGMFADIVVAV